MHECSSVKSLFRVTCHEARVQPNEVVVNTVRTAESDNQDEVFITSLFFLHSSMVLKYLLQKNKNFIYFFCFSY